jgi:hypothetical protein
LDDPQKNAFIFEFTKDLERLGCYDQVYLTRDPTSLHPTRPTGMVFDCTLSTDRILEAFDREIQRVESAESIPPSRGAIDQRAVPRSLFNVQAISSRPARVLFPKPEEAEHPDTRRFGPRVRVCWDGVLNHLGDRYPQDFRATFRSVRGALHTFLEKTLEEIRTAILIPPPHPMFARGQNSEPTPIRRVPDPVTIAVGLTAVWLRRRGVPWSKRPWAVDLGLRNISNAAKSNRQQVSAGNDPASSFKRYRAASEQKAQLLLLWKKVRLAGLNFGNLRNTASSGLVSSEISKEFVISTPYAD